MARTPIPEVDSSAATVVGPLRDSFLRHLAAENRSPSTRVTYAAAIDLLGTFTAAAGMPELPELRREHIEAFLVDLGHPNAGCTPGFWKTHPEAWQGYTTDQTIGSVFASADEPYASMTLLDGLSLQGGNTLAGAQEILLRAAIAFVLNESPDPATKKIAAVNAALDSGSRNKMINLAARLDTINNGDCLWD